MPMPDWAEGLAWQCRGCTATYPSLWARDQCEMEDAEADRESRRRTAPKSGRTQ